LDGAGEVFYPLRELQSKKVISKSVVYKNSLGETQTIHLKVEGPVFVIGCTTKERVYEDIANRSFLYYLDENSETDIRRFKTALEFISAGYLCPGSQELRIFLPIYPWKGQYTPTCLNHGNALSA